MVIFAHYMAILATNRSLGVGLVVTSVPKVPIWKARYFNSLFPRSTDNILIYLEIQLFSFGGAVLDMMYL